MKKIVVFGARHCFYCNVLKDRLTKGGFEFDFIDVGTQFGREQFKPFMEKYGCEDIPQIIVGNKVLLPKKSFQTIDMAYELIKKLMEE